MVSSGCLGAERHQVLHVARPGTGQEVHKAEENLRRCARITQGAVPRNGRGTEVGGDRGELVVANDGARQGQSRESERIDDPHARPGERARRSGSTKKTDVEGCVVCHQDDGVLRLEARPRQEAVEHGGDGIGAANHGGRDTGQRGDGGRDGVDGAHE